MLAGAGELKRGLAADWPPPKMTTLSPVGFLSRRSSVSVMHLLKPGMGIVRGTEPVATMISSKPPRVPTSLISVLNLTSMLAFAISRRYQSMSSLSFSLKVMLLAVMNRPPRVSVFSNRTGLCPRLLSMSAHSIPPMPPPMTATFLGFVVGQSCTCCAASSAG